MRIRVTKIFAMILTGVLLIIIPITGACTSTQPTPTLPTPSNAAFVNIVLDPEQFMAGFNYQGEFRPSTIAVATGGTVTWTNKDNKDHTVVSKDGIFDKHLSFGESFSHTFTQKGSFNYYDRLYDNMDGTVVVK